MSKLPYEVKATVEWQLRRFKQLKRELEGYKSALIPSVTPNYGGTGGGSGGESRPTERITEILLNDAYIKTTEHTVRVIESVLERLTKEDKKLIELIYWKGRSADATAMILCMDRATVFRHRAAVLRTIAQELGLIPANQKA